MSTKKIKSAYSFTLPLLADSKKLLFKSYLSEKLMTYKFRAFFQVAKAEIISKKIFIFSQATALWLKNLWLKYTYSLLEKKIATY